MSASIVHTSGADYQVGDVVEYFPHMCHGLNCNHRNEYPWVFGLKQNPHYVTNKNTGQQELEYDVVEVDEGRLHRGVLPGIRNSPNPVEQMKNLVPLRPKSPWRATVKAVNPDGTLDLEVESNIAPGMIVLSYLRVEIDESGMKPHSCRKGTEHGRN